MLDCHDAVLAGVVARADAEVLSGSGRNMSGL